MQYWAARSHARQILGFFHMSLHPIQIHKVPFGICTKAHKGLMHQQCKAICVHFRRHSMTFQSENMQRGEWVGVEWRLTEDSRPE